MSVIDTDNYSTVATVDVGTEPQAVVASPNGKFVYVANANDNTVQVIDTSSNTVTATIPVGRSPRALAITNDGDADDLDETLYVPNFFARPRAGFVPPSTANLGGSDNTPFPAGAKGQPVVGEGIFDDSREAVVDVVSTATNTFVDQVVLAPMADTGFNFARGAFVNTTPSDAPRTIFADGRTDGTQAQPTGAFPNLLQSIAIFNGRGFVPNSAASPEPPLRFNLNVQSLVSVFDITTNSELDRPDVQHEPRASTSTCRPGLLDAQVRDNTDRLFPSVPVDIDCSTATGACWVVSQGSDFIVRMDFDARQADHPRADRRRAVRAEPGHAHLHHRSRQRDQLGPQPARHRARRRRHARLRRLPDDSRRRRRRSRRQHRRCSASAPRSFRPIRRSSASCAARSTSSPRVRSGPIAAGAAARPAIRTAAPTA